MSARFPDGSVERDAQIVAATVADRQAKIIRDLIVRNDAALHRLDAMQACLEALQTKLDAMQTRLDELEALADVVIDTPIPYSLPEVA